MKFVGSFDQTMPQSWDEFSKRYCGSWMKASFPTGVDDVVYVSDVGAEKIYIENEAFGSLYINPVSTTELSPILLKAGTFQHNDTSMYLVRSPVRRNQRSMTSHNTRVFDILRCHLPGYTGEHLGYDKVKSAVARIRYTLPEAIDLSSSMRSVAVSRDYSVNNIKGTVYLWCRTLPIGKLDGDCFRVDKHFWQEFRDFLARNNLPYFAEAI